MSTEPKKSAEQIEQRIGTTRRQLAESVGTLSDKADLKAQAHRLVDGTVQRADETVQRAERAADEAKIKAAEARDLAAAKASAVRSQVRERSPLATAALLAAPVLLLVLIIVRRSRRR